MDFSGKIDHLPAGVLYLRNEKGKVLDSVEVINGEFEFDKIDQSTKNVYASLEHIDGKGIKRLFQFRTNKKFRGGSLFSQYFIIEDSLRIYGDLKEFIPKSMKLYDNIKLVYPSELVKGKQNDIMNSVELLFSSSDSSVFILKQKIKRYPWSIYILHELENHKEIFSTTQLSDLASLFSQEVKGNKEFKALVREIRNRRDNILTIKNARMLSPDNTAEYVVDSIAKINMVVLWASWCGPCVKEMPDLKKVYDKFKGNKSVNIVSVSLDAGEVDWKNALKKHRMPWRQLRVPDSIREDAKLIFQFDGSIPAVLFVNNKGEILKKYVGYENGNGELFSEYLFNAIKKE